MAILRVLPRMKDSPYVFLPPLGGMLSDMSISAVVRRMQECGEKTCRAGFMNPRSKRAAVLKRRRAMMTAWAGFLEGRADPEFMAYFGNQSASRADE